MSSVIYGVDLSSWQAGISLRGIAGEGFAFAFCKVTQGSGYVSPDWPRQRDEARTAGLVLAGYHYIDESDPAAQAANCARALGDLAIPVALDFEKGGGSIGNYRRVLDAFCAAGMHVALSYIPRWYWADLDEPDLADLPPLWSSRYPSTQRAPASVLYQAVEQAGGSLSKYWQGYGGNTVAVLQFASTATVQGRDVDANAFYGSRDELAALLAAGTTDAGGAPAWEDDDMPTAREIADAILDTPIPRLGDHLPPQLVGGTTTLRNEVAWMTNSTLNGAWADPSAGARVARQVDALAAAGASGPDELRALRQQLDRIEAALAGAAAAPAGGPSSGAAGPDWRAELRAAVAELRTVTVQFPDPKAGAQ
jgi:hypothetical protein